MVAGAEHGAEGPPLPRFEGGFEGGFAAAPDAAAFIAAANGIAAGGDAGDGASEVAPTAAAMDSGAAATVPRRKRSRSWQCLEHMAVAAWEHRGAFGRPPQASGLVEKYPDELSRLEKLIGGEEVDRFRRAFDRADVGRDGEIVLSDALVAFNQLGRRALPSDLTAWMAGRPDNSRRNSLAFVQFVKAFAGIFHAPPHDPLLDPSTGEAAREGQPYSSAGEIQ